MSVLFTVILFDISDNHTLQQIKTDFTQRNDTLSKDKMIKLQPKYDKTFVV